MFSPCRVSTRNVTCRLFRGAFPPSISVTLNKQGTVRQSAKRIVSKDFPRERFSLERLIIRNEGNRRRSGVFAKVRRIFSGNSHGETPFTICRGKRRDFFACKGRARSLAFLAMHAQTAGEISDVGRKQERIAKRRSEMVVCTRGGPRQGLANFDGESVVRLHPDPPFPEGLRERQTGRSRPISIKRGRAKNRKKDPCASKRTRER